ncbi:hypothetical protein DPMN_132967 [Dreissena polymorpha]|uniref:Uncharacterized protein n=1 Tax=Dreissena polymorpha TaxID=45954 RepID=A0A9D4FUP2_DREPO|nr:hypothetical protein DPMN_132920 [Dreissena polymorpha]KAH3804679.1 hypothetical protein DPMN_132967 [Dreissena polymorpha]
MSFMNCECNNCTFSLTEVLPLDPFDSCISGGSYGGLCDTGSKCPLDKNASCDLKTSMCICLADAAAFNGVCVLSKHH